MTSKGEDAADVAYLNRARKRDALKDKEGVASKLRKLSPTTRRGK